MGSGGVACRINHPVSCSRRLPSRGVDAIRGSNLDELRSRGAYSSWRETSPGSGPVLSVMSAPSPLLSGPKAPKRAAASHDAALAGHFNVPAGVGQGCVQHRSLYKLRLLVLATSLPGLS
jgi:hypothetical protein